MIGKYILNLKTSRALKTNEGLRQSEGYLDAKSIGVLFSYQGADHFEQSMGLVDKLESDGKKVEVITFTKEDKNTEYNFPHFSDKDLKPNGSWRNTDVEQFQQAQFDYVICLDESINKYTKNILASTRAKCRVGCYAEGQDKYFELMINADSDQYERFLDQLYHYLKKMRNG